VITSGGDDRTVRVWRLAGGSPPAHPLDLFEPTYGIAFIATIIVTAVGGTSLSTSPSPHYPYESASCSAASDYRHDHRIMAGYPVQRGHPPAITWEAARRCLRDSGTLSGTSLRHEALCRIPRAAGRDWREYLWI
jgi:hypothetical protein